MKKIMLMLVSVVLFGCATPEPKTYPYGMTEDEWRELSIKDKAIIRRDYYLLEKGQMNLINPDLDIEGKGEKLGKGQIQVLPPSPSNYVTETDVPEISFEPEQTSQPESLIH